MIPHDLRFVEVSQDLVRCLVESIPADKVDFPMKPSESEWKIINSNLDASVLLRGGSGTGKTTCLLHRMWIRWQASMKARQEYRQVRMLDSNQ